MRAEKNTYRFQITVLLFFHAQSIGDGYLRAIEKVRNNDICSSHPDSLSVCLSVCLSICLCLSYNICLRCVRACVRVCVPPPPPTPLLFLPKCCCAIWGHLHWGLFKALTQTLISNSRTINSIDRACCTVLPAFCIIYTRPCVKTDSGVSCPKCSNSGGN